MTTISELVLAARESHGKRTHVNTIGYLVEAVAQMDRQRSMAAHPSASPIISRNASAELRQANEKIAALESLNEQLRTHLRDADQRIINQREQLAQMNTEQSSKVRELTAQLTAAESETAGLRKAFPVVRAISEATMQRQAVILDKVAVADRLHALVLAAFVPRDSKVVQLDEYRAALGQLREYADAEHAKASAA